MTTAITQKVQPSPSTLPQADAMELVPANLARGTEGLAEPTPLNVNRRHQLSATIFGCALSLGICHIFLVPTAVRAAVEENPTDLASERSSLATEATKSPSLPVAVETPSADTTPAVATGDLRALEPTESASSPATARPLVAAKTISLPSDRLTDGAPATNFLTGNEPGNAPVISAPSPLPNPEAAKPVAIATAPARTGRTSPASEDAYAQQLRDEVAAMRPVEPQNNSTAASTPELLLAQAAPAGFRAALPAPMPLPIYPQVGQSIEIPVPAPRSYAMPATTRPIASIGGRGGYNTPNYVPTPGTSTEEYDSPSNNIPPTGAPAVGFIWPTRAVLTSRYGWRWGRMHRGIDLAGPVGTPIVAAADGVVIKAGWDRGGYGNLVEVQHADGTVTRYAHNSRMAVSVGQPVRQGEHIADMGSTGRSTGPHLHFEIHPANSGAVNPIAYLPSRQRFY